MCGIFGVTALPKTQLEHARAARDVMAHRGPDGGHDYYQESTGIFLGHRRLSIIDLSTAADQPLHTPDGAISLIFNGEIYNFRELRDELAKEGVTFTSDGDGEAILYGYQRWGLQKLLSKLDGMFAIVLYDAKQGQLHLVRDQLGIKPMLYGLHNGQFAFASELKALTALWDNLTVDNTALYDFLTYRYIPTPKTLYNEVKQLPAAHALTINLTDHSQHMWRYWEPELTFPDYINEVQASDYIRHAVIKAVKDQQVADVPLGFFLSGGVDSACVIAAAAEENPNIAAYTVGFNGSHRDETAEATAVANHLNIEHHKLSYDLQQQDFSLEQLHQWYDQPFSDTSAWPSYLVCKAAREHVTVALSGDGGDELFAGYRWYQQQPSALQIPAWRPFLSLLRHYAGPLGRKAANRLEPFTPRDGLEQHHYALASGLPASWRNLWKEPLGIPQDYDDLWSFRPHWREDLPHPLRQQWLDIHTFLPDDILTKMDRVSMAVSLEVRVPLLSVPVVELALNLPPQWQMNKKLLKDAFVSCLPQGHFERKKTGFSLPMASWDQCLRTAPHPTIGVLENLYSDLF